MLRDIASQASLSAIEIDRYIRTGERRNFPNATEVAKEIESSSREKPNPLDSLLYWNLFWPNLDDRQGKTQQDTYLHANLFANDLRRFEEFNRDKQEELMNTCIRLSRLMMSEAGSYRMRLAA